MCHHMLQQDLHDVRSWLEYHSPGMIAFDGGEIQNDDMYLEVSRGFMSSLNMLIVVFIHDAESAKFSDSSTLLLANASS